jgi:hypothetical protein
MSAKPWQTGVRTVRFAAAARYDVAILGSVFFAASGEENKKRKANSLSPFAF